MKNKKHIKGFSESTVLLNTPLVSESFSNEDKSIIDGSGLFFFNTRLDDETKLKIAKWYRNLSNDDKKYVDILRYESADEAVYFSRLD